MLFVWTLRNRPTWPEIFLLKQFDILKFCETCIGLSAFRRLGSAPMFGIDRAKNRVFLNEDMANVQKKNGGSVAVNLDQKEKENEKKIRTSC